MLHRITIEGEPNYVMYPAIKMSNPNDGNLFHGDKEIWQPTGGDSHQMIRIGKSKNTEDGNTNVGADTR